MPDDPRFAPAKAPERYPTEAVGAPFEPTLRVLRHTPASDAEQVPGAGEHILPEKRTDLFFEYTGMDERKITYS